MMDTLLFRCLGPSSGPPHVRRDVAALRPTEHDSPVKTIRVSAQAMGLPSQQSLSRIDSEQARGAIAVAALWRTAALSRTRWGSVCSPGRVTGTVIARSEAHCTSNLPVTLQAEMRTPRS